MKSVELKIMAKTAAAEARIIRAEERKMASQVRYLREKDNGGRAVEVDMHRNKVYLHRVGPLRQEARALNLARAFLKGLAYPQVEFKTKSSLKEMVTLSFLVHKLVHEYGPEDEVFYDDIEDWMGIQYDEQDDDVRKTVWSSLKNALQLAV